jgi:hypothetical protein
MRLLLFTINFFITTVAIAQSGLTWLPVVDVAPSNYGNQHPRIEIDSHGSPQISWGKFSTNEIYFTKWQDTAFLSPVILNPATPAFITSAAAEEMTVYGDTTYIVFKGVPEDTSHMFLITSHDGGVNFSIPAQIDSLLSYSSQYPVITVDSIGNPVVGFMKFDLGFINPVYVVKRSNDFGNTFEPETLASMYLGENVSECTPGAIVCSGNISSMLYRDNFNDFRTIWCGLSNDDANTFPNFMQVDQTSWMTGNCPASGPDAIIIGDSLYTVFMSGASGEELSYLSSASLSTSFANPSIQLIDSTTGFSNQNFPRISNYGNRTSIVCRQSYNGDGQLAFFYTNDITQGISKIFDTLATGNISNEDVVMFQDTVHVVWQDDNSETIKYRKGYRSTINVNDEQLNQNILLYPCPVNDHLTVYGQNNQTLSGLKIYDITGKYYPVSFNKNGNKIICDNLKLKSGLYFLEVTGTHQEVTYRKFQVINFN